MTIASVPSRHFAVVREIPVEYPPALVHPGWLASFPWLVQGTTTRGQRALPFDLGLFSAGSSEAAVRSNWEDLCVATQASCVMHAQQMHGSEVRVHVSIATGLELAEPCDGHATALSGILLAVTVADCVPVFVVDSTRRAVAILHAGWRGAAAGILERALDAMAAAFGTRASDAHLHLGPSICGTCYEVGPEVFDALGQPVPDGPTPIDLRAALGHRALAAGVSTDRISISHHCTRCSNSGLFSHRGGDASRQVGYLGIRS